MRIYYQKLVVIAVFIFFTIPTLFGQNSGGGCEKPFNEIVLEYFITSGLSEPTIYVLFEKQINEDWYFDFEFSGGDLIDIIQQSSLITAYGSKIYLKSNCG